MNTRRILVFAGTTEGRELIEWLAGRDPNVSSGQSGTPYKTPDTHRGIQVIASTATEYGKVCLGSHDGVELLAGRRNVREMEKLLKEKQIDLVVDATHPFATVVTEHIRTACEAAGVPCLRCLREESRCEISEADGVVWVDSVEQAVGYLKTTEGNILIATGSKELQKYTEIPDYRERCYVRVLSTVAAVSESAALGFEGKHLIAMQGPFSREMNEAMLRHTKARFFVTKESGKAGGFEEKLAAAHSLGASLVVVARPKEKGMSLREVCEYLGKWWS